MIAPQPGGDLTRARASLRTARGTIGVNWQVEDDGDGNADIALTVNVPDQTTAVVRLPGAADVEIGAGRHEFRGSSAMPAG